MIDFRPRRLATATATDVGRRGGIGPVPAPAFDGLRAREREILARVVAGASNRDIATALFISPKTVSVHVSALLRKFGVSGRGDLSGSAVGRLQAAALTTPWAQVALLLQLCATTRLGG
jgi:DNA-binding CsgD family transcriptional regulator